MLRKFSLCLFLISGLLAAEPVGFNTHIRPVLSDHCFACHGFDANAREANLRLDTPEGALADRKAGAAIIPGDPENSLIWQRITSTDPDEVMPPPDHLVTLDDAEKALIRQWISEGARYEKHWTFLPVEKPQVPDLAPHPVDALVTQKLKPLDLGLAPRADKRTLVRRLSFDLRGLPPSPEEVQTFLADDSPEAWENLVDAFLADPAFGERFAWPWLDAARYADSNGFQNDAERTMWPWRDWVIEAFNKNLPFDDFTVWQIAGDLLPNATGEQILATGFLRNHAINGEGGSIPEENRVNYVFDMTETVGTVWMGLTFNCCRCHDHKYDPLSQKEYYGLTAFFNQTPVTGAGGDPQTKPILAVPTPEQAREKESLLAQLKSTREKENTLLDERLRQAGPAPTATATPWQALVPAEISASEPGLKFTTLDDQSILSSGSNPDQVDLTVKAPLKAQTITALRLDTLRHESMTGGGLARSDSGNFVLTSFEIFLQRDGEPRRQIALERPTATFEQGAYLVTGTLDGKPETGWAVYDGRPISQDHAALFHFREPLLAKESDQLEIVLRSQSPHAKHFPGRLRLSLSDQADPSLDTADPTIATLLARAPAERTPEETKRLREHFRQSHPEAQKLAADINSLESRLAAIEKAAPKVMVMADQPERRPTHLLSIGSYDARRGEVPAVTPAVLPPLSPDGEGAPDRLDLARWLVSREHPLTSRVTVNRLWQDLFGIGLIKSPEDLGVQSEIPVHPELLDWLAADFMDSGWDFKKLIKTIVTSEVYRQSSQVDSLALQRDPDNRLLARAPRYRLASWMIRDQALALSGRLVRELGGEPVKPWQPEGLWAEVTFGKGKKQYVPDSGEKLQRRALYTFWRRISAPPMIFDNAKRETCEVGRYQTNSPLHALAILNDPHYLEAARGLAYRSHRLNAEAPLATAFELITCRPPNEREAQAIEALYQDTLAHFQKQTAEAEKLLAVGELATSEELEIPVQAALTTTVLSLLNTDEALTRE